MENNSGHNIEVGTVINDKYVILEFIAKGGMGEVYRAHQINLKRDVAIKMISKEWLESFEDEGEAEIGLQRFRNEVQAMAQIRHPNILQIYDYGYFSIKKEDESSPAEYISMEYVPGGTLRSTMSDEGFFPDEDLTREWLRDYFLPVLEGVQILHDAKIIHRDLKPGNVLMDGKTPKIADFGLARSSMSKPVTQSIDVKGTPPYMSPEHFFDLRRTDHRADIYSLGKILFEAIDGKITSKTIPFKQARLPNTDTVFFKKLDQIIQHATAEDRKERFNSVEEFRDAIVEAIKVQKGKSTQEISVKKGAGISISHSKWVWGGIAISIISVLLMTLWHLLGEPGKSDLSTKDHTVITGKTEKPGPFSPFNATLKHSGTPSKIIKGKDGATLRLIPGGAFLLPAKLGKQAGEKLRMDPFYLGETEVTNHQFAEFLNQVLTKISVEEDVVKGYDQVWFLLGEVTKGYEPIIYLDGKFFVKDPAFHSHPLVRVTPYGAAAYARFYGRRLPSEMEWLYAKQGEDYLEKKPVEGLHKSSIDMTHMERMHAQTDSGSPDQKVQSNIPSPVAQFKPNIHGIIGLAGNVSEWVLSGSKYKIMPSAIFRHPWEAFENIGFRTAWSTSKGVKKKELKE